MDIDRPTAHAPRGSAAQVPVRQPVLACLVSLLAAVVALGAVALGTAIEQAANPPTCHGIGWGCTPDPATTALLVGLVAGAPAVVVAWSLTWIGWAVTRQRTRRARVVAVWWPAWVMGAGALVVGVLAVTTAG